MANPQASVLSDSHSIPVGVLIGSLQEYGACLQHWESHADAIIQEGHMLRYRISELECANKEAEACQEIQRRLIDMQRELISYLKSDLVDIRGETGTPTPPLPSLHELGANTPFSPPHALSSSLKIQPNSFTDLYPVDALVAAAEPAESTTATPNKRKARTERGRSPKRYKPEGSS